MSEHTEQAALFQWARLLTPRYPELQWLAAWPNGGFRAKKTAALLKEEGVQPGVPDILLHLRRGDCPGVAIEMKVGTNKPTEAQQRWLAHLASQGWKVAVCYSWQDAACIIAAHVGFDAAESFSGAF